MHFFSGVAQETSYGPGFQTILVNNPAFSGATGDGTIRLSYLNFYPGNSYNLHSVYASYDTYIPALHGGAGFWVSDDYLGGIINDVRGGLSYAYALQAGEDVYVHGGLSVQVFHRGFDFGSAVLPDMIDPIGGVVLPTGEALAPVSKTVIDVGTGFLLIYRNFFAGLALNHLSQPDLATGEFTTPLKRKILLNAALNIPLNENGLNLTPAGYFELQGDHVSGAAGTSLGGNSLSANMLIMADNMKNLDVQTGFSLRFGRTALFYNYRLNVLSGNSLMPLSLLHQTGLAFGLYSVDKRNVPGTIRLPDL